MNCPLCNSKEIDIVEQIAVKDIAGLYGKLLGGSITLGFPDKKDISLCNCNSCDLKFFHPAMTGSEEFYEKLQKFEWYYLQDKYEYDFAGKFIDDNASVLEIGCGKGSFAEIIVAKKYTGLEFSQKAVSMARQRGLNVINESVEEHAKGNSQRYDVVCSFQVLEHVSEINKFLKNAIECLKPGGLFMVTVPSADSFLPLVRNGILNMPPHHVSWWHDKTLHFIAEMFDLGIVELEHEPLSDIHKELYASTVACIALNDLFGRKRKLIDTSFIGKVVGLSSVLLGKLYSRGINDIKMRPNGHSVIVVYRKQGK